MISHLSIENFKSIRKLDLNCKKINIFIGEPDTGKSNILEALGVLSWCGQSNLKKEPLQHASFEYNNSFPTTVPNTYSHHSPESLTFERCRRYHHMSGLKRCKIFSLKIRYTTRSQFLFRIHYIQFVTLTSRIL